MVGLVIIIDIPDCICMTERRKEHPPLSSFFIYYLMWLRSHILHVLKLSSKLVRESTKIYCMSNRHSHPLSGWVMFRDMDQVPGSYSILTGGGTLEEPHTKKIGASHPARPSLKQG